MIAATQQDESGAMWVGREAKENFKIAAGGAARG